jgi:hypothetical protein
VEVARSAAVWELKAAIEELFFALFDDTEKTIPWYGPATLSPSHDVRELSDCDFAITKWCLQSDFLRNVINHAGNLTSKVGACLL